MFSFFERLISPFPDIEPPQPPNTLVAFCRHYTKGIFWPLFWMTILTSLLAVFEVYLFGFMGQLVDWLIDKDPETLFQEQGNTLIFIAFMLLIGMPILVFIHAVVIHQILMGNFPMSIRWMSHRYLMKQSLGFYQNEFAGRIATKVMQTSLAIRESVMKLLNVMVYILVYFTSMLVVIGNADTRLIAPVIIWLIFYVAVQYYFVPKLKNVSTDQAHAP